MQSSDCCSKKCLENFTFREVYRLRCENVSAGSEYEVSDWIISKLRSFLDEAKGSKQMRYAVLYHFQFY